MVEAGSNACERKPATVSHDVPEPIKEKAIRAFKTFKGKIMGFGSGLRVKKNLKKSKMKKKNLKKSKTKNSLTQQSSSKLSIGLIGVIELMEEAE